MKNYIFIVGVLLLGCSSDVSTSENKIVGEIQPDTAVTKTFIDSDEVVYSDTLDRNLRKLSGEERDDLFLKFYEQLTEAISEKNYEKFNKCIHPYYGLYVIETRGAMPGISKYYDISKYKSSTNKAFLEFKYSDIKVMPVFDELPMTICDKDIYDKKGAFAQYSDILKQSQIWNHAGLNEKEIQAIEFLVETVQITVVNTSNYVYHFSKIDEKWYLTFMDIRIPCSA